MTSNEEIRNELLSISPALVSINNTNVFKVPDHYFDELPVNILQLVNEDNAPSFGDIKKKTLSIPDGYFDGLAVSILAKIQMSETSSSGEEMATLSPVIAAIGNRNVFTVPSGYFSGIADKLAADVQPAKVVEMKKRTGLIRYMAAAAITGMIGLTIFNLSDKTSNNHADASPVMAKAQQIIKNKSFDTELNTISDKDIEAYLKESGEDVNAAMVASAATDDNNLPSAEDYIINDNTLDEYLNKINLNN